MNIFNVSMNNEFLAQNLISNAVKYAAYDETMKRWNDQANT